MHQWINAGINVEPQCHLEAIRRISRLQEMKVNNLHGLVVLSLGSCSIHVLYCAYNTGQKCTDW